MARGDRTGPTGMGPRTGRAAGYCSGYGMAGYMNPALGGGFGPGFGGGREFMGAGGRGWRHCYYATGLPAWRRFGGYAMPYEDSPTYMKPDPGLESRALKNQAELLQSELDFIKKRLAEMETEADAD